jgi:superfamily II DNA or RNA helicase
MPYTGAPHLEVGGKYRNQIVFRGNIYFAPREAVRIIKRYFRAGNALVDITRLPEFMREIGRTQYKVAVGQAVTDLYNRHLATHTATLTCRDGRFGLLFGETGVTPTLFRIVQEFFDGNTMLKDPFSMWRFDYRWREKGGIVKRDQAAQKAFAQWATNKVSVEPSLEIHGQISAYYHPRRIDADVQRVLEAYIDEFYTLVNPLALDEFTAALNVAGATVSVHPGCAEIVESRKRIEATAAEIERLQPQGGGVQVSLDTSAPEYTAFASSEARHGDGHLIRSPLYPFQRLGAAFLATVKDAVLADDMGLGKTAQAIAACALLKRDEGVKRVLVICPASVKLNWADEIARFSGETVTVIDGTADERRLQYKMTDAFFVVINYELSYRDEELIYGLKPDVVILDEAQRIKSHEAKTTRIVMGIPRRHSMVLTGTPLEIHLMELYNIFKFVNGDVLGKNVLKFRERYVVLDRFGGIAGYQRVKEVSRRIAATTLRRTKEDTLAELPDVVENNLSLSFGDEQWRIYADVRRGANEFLSKSEWDAVDFGNVLTIVQRLREVCDTPEMLFPEHKKSAKLDELREIVGEQVKDRGRKIIIFTQWTRMAIIINRMLDELGITHVYLHGGLAARERQDVITKFQKGEADCFVSTDAGSAGINLQAASIVVNYDLPFNPAKVAQRVARAHRIGQKDTVNVINLVVRGTIEDNLVGILRKRRQLFDEVFRDIETEGAASAPTRNTRLFYEELLR